MEMTPPSVKKVVYVVLHVQNSLNELQQIQTEEDLKINFSLCLSVTHIKSLHDTTSYIETFLFTVLHF